MLTEDYENALIYIKSRNYKTAILLLEKMHAINDRNVIFWSSFCYLKLSSFDKLLNLLQAQKNLVENDYELLKFKYYAGKYLNKTTVMISSLKKIIEKFPKNSSDFKIYANLLIKLEKYEETLIVLEKAKSLFPSEIDIEGRVFGLKMQIGDFSVYSIESIESFEKLNFAYKVDSQKPPPSPFSLLAFIDDPKVHKKMSENFARFNLAKMKYQEKKMQKPNEVQKKVLQGIQKIKVGYYSSDYFSHATMRLIIDVFEQHDDDLFEFHHFSFSGIKMKNDIFGEKISNLSNFHDISSNNYNQVKTISQRLGIQIAVDLKGYTQGARPEIFLNKVAPIQVNFLGYPGTLGDDIYDYIIADKIVIPDNSEKFYCEKVLRLPNCYQPNSQRMGLAQKKISREDLGVAEDTVLLGCFNNDYKVGIKEITIWAEVLQQVPHAQLCLLCTNESSKVSFLNFFSSKKIDLSRIKIFKRAPYEEHLLRISLIDLALDTFNYNSHTTGSDYLYFNIPFVSKIGNSFPARVGASLLNTIGLLDLVAKNESEYKELIIDLCLNKQKLLDARKRIFENKHILFDSKKFAADIENLYKKIHQEKFLH